MAELIGGTQAAQAGVRFQEYTVCRRRALPRQQGDRNFPLEAEGGAKATSNPALRRAFELVDVVLGGRIHTRAFLLFKKTIKREMKPRCVPGNRPCLLHLHVTANAAHLAIISPAAPSAPLAHPHAALHTFYSSLYHSQPPSLAHLAKHFPTVGIVKVFFFNARPHPSGSTVKA